MTEGDQEAEPETVAQQAAALREQAKRLTVAFRRLFWVAMAGLVPTAAAVVGGNWDAHPGWCLGVAGLGQAWLLGMALWAFQVYGRLEAMEQAAGIIEANQRNNP